MPRSYKPSKKSRDYMCRDNSKCFTSGNGYHCPESSVTGSHWWWIDSPDGPISVGVCRYCGEQRPFANTLEASLGLGGRG